MDTLDRLYRRLLDAVQHEYADDAAPPLTIAEVYQKLVPYRTVRAELGFGELAEYEHTLLRLLSGECDYVRVELEPVRDELRRELRSANPILGIYRDYAAVGVRLASVPVAPATTGPRAAEASRRAPAGVPAAEPTPRAAEAFAPPPVAAQAHVQPPTVQPPTVQPPIVEPRRDAPRAVSCRSCAQPLPQGREVRFCPHCGTSQIPVPCRDCGTALEPEWAFCIRCGAARRAAARPSH